MSLTISGSPTTYSASTAAPVADTATSASASSSVSTGPANRYLGGYISSATAALSLLTQTSTEAALSEESLTSNQGGSTLQKDGASLYEITSNLGRSVGAQAFSSSTSFSVSNGKVQAKGSYDATVAAAQTSASGANSASTGGTAGDLKVSVSLDTGYSEFGHGINFTVKVGNDPKHTDPGFINDQGSLGPETKQAFQGAFEDWFKYEGLSANDAKQQAAQVTDFLWSAATAVNTNQLPTGTTGSASSTTASSSTTA